MRGELQGLGPFRLQRVLGEGERAVVYDADREGVGLGGALKVLRPALCADAEERDAFFARARAGQRVATGGAVTVLEVGELAEGLSGDRVGSTAYALLEKVDGVALSDLFPKRGRPRFSEAAAANVVEEVLNALAAASRATPPVVHGRLDAANVLVDLDGEVRVTGFGTEGDPRADFLALARLAQNLTPDWSPEADSWLDGLQDHDDRFGGPSDALAALPVRASLAGKAALSRAAKRARKRQEQELAAAEGGGPGDGQAEGARPRRGAAPARAAAAGIAGQRPAPTPGPLDDALRQARFVGLLCAGVLAVALLIEVFGFAG